MGLEKGDFDFSVLALSGKLAEQKAQYWKSLNWNQKGNGINLMANYEKASIKGSTQGRELYLELSGELRIPQFMSLSNCIDSFLFLNSSLDKGNIEKVTVDAVDASRADSTIMGLLAKFAIEVHRRLGIRPVLLCQTIMLQNMVAMSLEQVYDLMTCTRKPKDSGSKQKTDFFPHVSATKRIDEQVLKETIADAHEQLAELNPDKAEEFMEVVEALRGTPDTDPNRAK